MTAEQLLTRLADAKRSGNGWIARCPVHDDDKPSLSIAQADGRILLKCFAGCRTADIVRALNLTMADLFVSNDGHGQRAGSSSDPLHWLASYCQVPKAFLEKLPLSADNGRVVFKFDGTDVVKLRLAGAKDFRWQPVGAPTPPLWPLPGAELPEQIWLCEGESDTIVARYLGLEAFAVTKGAGTSLKPHEAEALAQRGAKAIVIAFDADGDGRAGARKLADVLAGAGLAVRIVDLAEAGLVDPLLASKDLRDAWRASQDREALRQQLVAAADCAEILSAALTV
ncbi:MAG: toprim domain-containing protein, partial [Anaerolineae bacterium]